MTRSGQNIHPIQLSLIDYHAIEDARQLADFIEKHADRDVWKNVAMARVSNLPGTTLSKLHDTTEYTDMLKSVSRLRFRTLPDPPAVSQSAAGVSCSKRVEEAKRKAKEAAEVAKKAAERLKMANEKVAHFQEKIANRARASSSSTKSDRAGESVTATSSSPLTKTTAKPSSEKKKKATTTEFAGSAASLSAQTKTTTKPSSEKKKKATTTEFAGSAASSSALAKTTTKPSSEKKKKATTTEFAGSAASLSAQTKTRSSPEELNTLNDISNHFDIMKRALYDDRSSEYDDWTRIGAGILKDGLSGVISTKDCKDFMTHHMAQTPHPKPHNNVPKTNDRADAQLRLSAVRSRVARVCR